MVRNYENIRIPILEYKEKTENEGKVALFNFENSSLIADGDSDTDWLELELMCERLRVNGDYRIVIVPTKKPTIKLFGSIMS